MSDNFFSVALLKSRYKYRLLSGKSGNQAKLSKQRTTWERLNSTSRQPHLLLGRHKRQPLHFHGKCESDLVHHHVTGDGPSFQVSDRFSRTLTIPQTSMNGIKKEKWGDISPEQTVMQETYT